MLEHDILGFYVTVEDVVAVEMGESFEGLFEEIGGIELGDNFLFFH